MQCWLTWRELPPLLLPINIEELIDGLNIWLNDSLID